MADILDALKGGYKSAGGACAFDKARVLGPGCSSAQIDSKASSSASISVGPFSSGNVGTSSSLCQDNQKCAPDDDLEQTNIIKVDRETTIDNSTTIMTRNSLKVLTECTNQMIVNSITSTKTSATQDVTLFQKLKISVDNVKGDVTIDGVGQEITIDMNNISQMSLSAFDNIRTDLATNVLQSFKSSINQETLDKMQADMATQTRAQQESALKARVEAKIDQTKTTNLPAAAPPLIPAENLNANTHQKQYNSTSIKEANKLVAPYTNKTDIEKTLETHVNNAVTQNFTKETINIMAQTILANQDMEIKISNIGGNVSIKNVKQTMNIILRQTLNTKMNIGTAIVNTLTNTLGVETDDQVIQKKVSQSGVTSKMDLRSEQAATQDLSSSMSYKQTLTESFGGSLGSCNSSGSSGSSFSSCCCCIILCVLIAMCGVGGSMGSPGGDEGEGEEEGETSESVPSKVSSPAAPAAAPAAEEEPGPVQAGGFLSLFF